jgi:short-subunit dehydrogenase
MTNETEWAVVTGASGGLGEAFASRLAKDGHPVLLVARRKEELERVVAEIRRGGGTAEAVVADLATAEGVRTVVRALDGRQPGVLINNAGFGAYGPFLKSDPDSDTRQVTLNIATVLSLTRALLPTMVARGRGRIINLASILSFMPVPYFATYAATKAFVLHFSEALAEEVRGTGVQVIAACPGPVRTDFIDVSGMGAMRHRLPLLTAQEVVRITLAGTRNRRIVRVIGRAWKLLVFAVRVTPRSLMARIMARVLSPDGAGGARRGALPTSGA